MIDKVIDVSADDGKIDWPKVKAWGCNGAMLKCTNALDFIDREYDNNVCGCCEQAIPFGSYMVIHPWESVLDQIHMFVNVADDLSRRHAIDWELKRGESSYKASLAIMLALNDLRRRVLPRPWLYLNLDYLLHRLRYADRVLSLCDVWYSNPSDSGLIRYPKDIKQPIAHQYTWKEKVPGIPGACDVSRIFAGTF